MRSYESYVATGYAWLPEVPQHWQIIAPKRRVHSRPGGGLIKGDCADEPAEGLFQGFSASGPDVWLREWDFEEPGIVLSAVGARCGKTFKADGKWGAVANTHCLFPAEGMHRDFLWYLTNSEQWWEKGGTAQPFVKVNDTLSRLWAFPPLAEQRAIALFLDRETAKIDALVEEQRRLIELLKEKRQAVILEAMKYSPSTESVAGFSHGAQESLPEGWSFQRLSAVCKFESAKAHEEFVVDEGPFVCVNARFVSSQGAHRKYCTRNLSPARRGDILMVMSDLPNGKALARAFLVEDDTPYAVNQRVCIVRPRNGNSRFFYYQLDRSEQLLRYNDGMNQTHLSTRAFTSLVLRVPPLGEQDEIAAFLDKQTTAIEGLIEESNVSIALLQERRFALIFAAVTGKIDVRELSNADTVAA